MVKLHVVVSIMYRRSTRMWSLKLTDACSSSISWQESAKKQKVGKAPVDSLCPQAQNGAVHEDYDAMLNQTDIGNNNNKFYVIQVPPSPLPPVRSAVHTHLPYQPPAQTLDRVTSTTTGVAVQSCLYDLHNNIFLRAGCSGWGEVLYVESVGPGGRAWAELTQTSNAAMKLPPASYSISLLAENARCSLLAVRCVGWGLKCGAWVRRAGGPWRRAVPPHPQCPIIHTAHFKHHVHPSTPRTAHHALYTTHCTPISPHTTSHALCPRPMPSQVRAALKRLSESLRRSFR